MSKASIAKSDPREELAAIRDFAKQREAELLPAVEKLETEERARAEKVEAERMGALRVEAAEAAKYLVGLAAKIDKAMDELAKLLIERRDAGEEFTRQFDKRAGIWVGHQFRYPKLIGSAAHNAGLGNFMHISDRGKLSLEFQDRQMLGGLL